MVSKDGISDLNQKMKMVKIEVNVKKEDRNRVAGSLSSLVSRRRGEVGMGPYSYH